MDTERRCPSALSVGDVLRQGESWHIILTIEEYFDEFYFIGTISVEDTEQAASLLVEVSLTDVQDCVNFFRLNCSQSYDVVVKPDDVFSSLAASFSGQDKVGEVRPLSEFGVETDSPQSSLSSF